MDVRFEVDGRHVAAFDAPAGGARAQGGGRNPGKTTTSESGARRSATVRDGHHPHTVGRRLSSVAEVERGGGGDVAAGVTPFGSATERRGSVRIPGSLTGLFTVKPQFARVPIFPESGADAPTLAR